MIEEDTDEVILKKPENIELLYKYAQKLVMVRVWMKG